MKASPRTIGVGLMTLGAIGLSLSIAAMTQRLRQHNREADFPRWKFADAVTASDIDYAGEPIRIADGKTETGDPAVNVTYRGETIAIPVGGRNQESLPGMLRYSDWLQVFEMEQTRGRAHAHKGHEEGAPARLVLVARQPAPGESDLKYLNRRAWLYDIVEFRKADDQTTTPAPEPLPAPAPDARAARTGAPPTSEFALTPAFARWRVNFSALPSYERTWQYAAALSVTPRLSFPTNKFTDDGMAAMNWTWPAAGFSGLSIVIGLIVTAGTLVRPPVAPRPSAGIGPPAPARAGVSPAR